MKFFYTLIVLIIYSDFVQSRNLGETEITAEEGIEVFQDEKYYLLKKNVIIDSDNFKLRGDKIKIYFQNDLYDIKKIDAFGNVNLNSDQFGILADGDKLIFIVKTEEIFISGTNSKLINKNTEMYSDGEIRVNNLSGDFFIEGKNSSLKAKDIYILSHSINGVFSLVDDNNDISVLNVFDNNIAYVKTESTEMYAKNISYSNEKSLIELKNQVKVIRDGEIITGDHGTLNTNNNSYKVRSNDKEKVKVIIKNTDE